MRKTFLAICFIILAVSGNVQAAVTEINNSEELRKHELKPKSTPEPEAEIKTIGDFKEFLKRRSKFLYTSVLDDTSGNASSMDIQHSAEYIAQQQQENKSTFQKIYESALERVSSTPKRPQREDVRDTSKKQQVNEQAVEWRRPNYDVINIELPPRGEKILVPAKEHIPYLFSDIQVTPNGLIDVTETIVVVANGEKLKHGLTRAVAKYSTSRKEKRTKVDLTLVSVTINDIEVPYKLEEDDNFILMVPKEKTFLEPGVYSYKFKYVMDKRLWYYDDFNELYWDVTGSSWNLVIGNAGAALTLPNGADPLGYSVLTGYPAYYNERDTIVSKLDAGTTGFIARRPLFVGEGIHIIASLPKDIFTPPSIGRLFSWFADDYGDVIFAILGLIAILASYLISWQQMNSKNNKQKTGLKRSAPMLRYLAKGIFDKISFGSFILELFRKNIIDIQKKEKDILLVKKTDNLKGLTRKEKKAVAELFINKESVLSVDTNNSLKLRRAYKAIEQDTQNKFRTFGLRLNLGYLFFSVGMLLLSEIFIAAVQIDVWSTLIVLIGTSMMFALSIWVWGVDVKNDILKALIKTLAVMLVVVAIFVAGIFIRLLAVLLILATIYIIFIYTELFAKRGGLIKNNIKEAVDYSDFLIKNKDAMSVGRNFMAQQPNILALELSEHFPKTSHNEDFYRLDIMEDVMKRF